MALGIVLGWAIASAGGPKPPPSPILCVSGFKAGSENLTVTHLYGDPICEAFEIENGAIEWRNLDVRLNALRVRVTEGGTLNGRSDVGLCDFVSGDVLRFPIKKLERGDEILLVHTPTGRLFYRLVVE